MAEVANRLNAFIDAYPQESQHILSQFVEYEHELVGIHSETRRIARSQEGKTLEREPPTPGITVAQLFTALLQTHHGNGYVLRPLLARDPNAGLGYIRITKFVVERQENLDIEHPV